MKFKRLALTLLILLPLGCGPQNNSTANNTTAGSCTPNVNDVGLQLLVKNLGSDTYSFQLCAPANPASVYSVYGGTNTNDLQPSNINLNGAWRQASITGINNTGQVFQVTFHPSDTVFAIYQDKSDGSGGYTFDATNVMVSPRALNF